MFGGILPLKLGGFRNSKPNFKEYSGKNEIKIIENQPKFELLEKNTLKIKLIGKYNEESFWRCAIIGAKRGVWKVTDIVFRCF